MFFGRKNEQDESLEDPATLYSRRINNEKPNRDREREKPSLLERLFGMGHDSDFIYYED